MSLDEKGMIRTLNGGRYLKEKRFRERDVRQFIKDLKEELLKDVVDRGWLEREITSTINALAGEGLI